MTAFLDTNILISVLEPREKFHDWAVQALEKCKSDGPALITDIVYCEFSVGMADLDAVNEAVGQLGLERYGRNSDRALFYAGRAFRKYKENGGRKGGVLPDFIIGAIAADAGTPLITTNQKDFAKYFPDIQLICPDA